MAALVVDHPTVDTVPCRFRHERARFEEALATGVITHHRDLEDFAGFGATHYAGLVMGA